MKKRIFLISLLTMILVLVFFSPALAKRPDVEYFEEPISDPFDIYCGDFKFDFEEVLSGKASTFYDKDDNPVRIQIHFEFDGTVTNTKTGTVMRSHAKGTNTEYLTGNRGRVETGIFSQLIAPNKGVVAIIAGKLVFDINDDIVSFSGVQRPPPDVDVCQPPFSDI